MTATDTKPVDVPEDADRVPTERWRGRFDEHADAPPLVEDALVDELLKGLRGRRRVDPVEGRVLVGRHDLLVALEGATQHVSLDLVGDLPVDRLVLLKLHCAPRLPKDGSRQSSRRRGRE